VIPEEQPLVPSPRARRRIRRALWFWAAWIILIAGINLGTLLRDPGYPFSILHCLQQRPRR